MPKYNIRKATGRKSSEAPQDKPTLLEKQSTHPLEVKTAVESMNLPDRPMDGKTVDLIKQFELFESIVSHNYLTKLDSCPIVAPVPEQLSNMGWYKISKIVLDGETFFPDQLSMLYTSLHNVAQTVALVIEKKGPDNIELYLGARDFSGNNFEASKLLENAIQGFLPGVTASYERDKTLFDNNSESFVASFSGVASLKDDKKEFFIQGLEKFIDATPSIPAFTAVIIADSVSRNQALSIIDAYSSIEDAISPLAQGQETISESDTEGVSTNITNTIGETLTETLSKTVTRTEGTNTGYTESESTTQSDTVNKSSNILRSTWSKIFGGKTGTSSNVGRTSQMSKQTGQHTDLSEADGKSSANAKQKSQSVADGTNSSKTSGTSYQITRTNKKALRYVDILDRQIDRLQNGMPFGLWSIGTYFVSQDPSTSKKLANIYKGCITGEESDVESSAVNVWEEKDSALLIRYLRDVRSPRFMVGFVNVSASSIATSKELAVHMALPQTSIPGVEVRERVSFGRNLNRKLIECRSLSDRFISIGNLSHLGTVSHQEVLLDVEELSKHIFITGSTGSGKSNTTYLLVNELLKKRKKVLVIEPTKGDYKKVFGGRDDVKVYGTRPNENDILRINPFAFPEEVRVDEHVERLVEIFGVCWPMYAAMPAVLKDSIFAAYEACGWDLINSECKFGRLYPTITDVIIQLKRIISSSEYSSDTKGDYIGALHTRLKSLTNGIYKTILTSDAIPYSELFDNSAIIDLHHIGSSETRSLLMGLLVLGLTEWRSSKGENTMDESLKYVTILEEAHCILPRVSKQQSQEGSNVIGKSVEMISTSIAEMRSYGQGFIIVDQSPSAVDEAAIRNTNTKIIMNLPDGEDRDIAGKSMGLTKDLQIAELAKLSTGEAIVFQRGWSEAILASIHLMPKSEFKPLSVRQDKTDIKKLLRNKPTELFISRFILNKGTLDRSEIECLKREILNSRACSTNKAILLESLDKAQFSSGLSDAVIDYVGLIDVATDLLNRSSHGSPSIIWDIRKYLAEYCDIIDTSTQNILLSMTFKWASSQSDKWLTICSQSMPN